MKSQHETFQYIWLLGGLLKPRSCSGSQRPPPGTNRVKTKNIRVQIFLDQWAFYYPMVFGPKIFLMLLFGPFIFISLPVVTKKNCVKTPIFSLNIFFFISYRFLFKLVTKQIVFFFLFFFSKWFPGPKIFSVSDFPQFFHLLFTFITFTSTKKSWSGQWNFRIFSWWPPSVSDRVNFWKPQLN